MLLSAIPAGGYTHQFPRDEQYPLFLLATGETEQNPQVRYHTVNNLYATRIHAVLETGHLTFLIDQCRYSRLCSENKPDRKGVCRDIP